MTVVLFFFERIKSKKVTSINEIKSKNDSISFLKCMCSKSTSSDELNESLLLNIKRYGYSESDKNRIHSFLNEKCTATEEFALTVIWAIIIYYEELNSCASSKYFSSSCLEEQNVVNF